MRLLIPLRISHFQSGVTNLSNLISLAITIHQESPKHSDC